MSTVRIFQLLKTLYKSYLNIVGPLELKLVSNNYISPAYSKCEEVIKAESPNQVQVPTKDTQYQSYRAPQDAKYQKFQC